MKLYGETTYGKGSVQELVDLSNGAAVTNSVIQWGVTVAGGGIVRRSALLEAAR